MRWLSGVVFVASLATVVTCLSPLAIPPPVEPAASLDAPRGLRHAQHAEIDAVLRQRAPRLGQTLRDQVANAIAEESEKAGFDPLLIVAIMAVESDFREGAVSPVGARGLMQLKPTTLYFVAEREGLRLPRHELDADPALAVRLGIRYLSWMQASFGKLELALMAYNIGPNALAQAVRERNLEPWRGYVKKVQKAYLALKKRHGGPEDFALAIRERGVPAGAPAAP